MSGFLTFNPGPSHLSEEVKQDLRALVDRGTLSISHRSSEFSDCSECTVRELRRFFGVPEGYEIFYTPSATDAMEYTIRNLVERSTLHFVSGSFSALFADIAASLGRQAERFEVPWGQCHDVRALRAVGVPELITMTANETSTGVLSPADDIAAVRRLHPESLLAVDITSIAGMRQYDLTQADVWLFSVQKGLGLPAGLGILFVSPRAMERANALASKDDHRAGLFTFGEMQAYMRRGAQTICTPNVLAIALLGMQLERWNARGGLPAKERETCEKHALLEDFLSSQPTFRSFVRDPMIRSISVCCVAGAPEAIVRAHERAADSQILFGNGYGKIKETTLRIANFPALTREDIARGIEVLERAVDQR